MVMPGLDGVVFFRFPKRHLAGWDDRGVVVGGSGTLTCWLTLPLHTYGFLCPSLGMPVPIPACQAAFSQRLSWDSHLLGVGGTGGSDQRNDSKIQKQQDQAISFRVHHLHQCWPGSLHQLATTLEQCKPFTTLRAALLLSGAALVTFRKPPQFSYKLRFGKSLGGK